MQSIIFLGSKPVGYRCLKHLLAVQDSLGLRTTGLLTQQRKEFGTEGNDLKALAAAHDVSIIPSLNELPGCDILYSVQYHQILQGCHIARARKIALNLHMAPLPEYRGANQFSYAIIEGKKEFGTTIHVIDERIDHGDILFENRFPISEGCWIEELYEQTLEASVCLFAETLPAVAAGTFTHTPQAALAAARGTSLHYKKDIAALKEIDLSWDAERIERHIRATSMPGFEPPYTRIGDQKVYFHPMSRNRPKRIVLTVTSDPAYDQRMIRICTSLQGAGYDVLLIGRLRPNSPELPQRPFRQRRIRQRIDRGKLFYALYNLKLFWTLLWVGADCFCAIDLDTILPVYYASRLRRKPRVYDAHELFTEMEEVVTRPATHRMWLTIERHTVPRFPHGYTVNGSYVREYERMYGVRYAIVRNATVLRSLAIPPKPERIILYQGAVNEGRCFPELLAAMKKVDARLVICGEGNFYAAAQALAAEYGLGDKVIFEGYVKPEELRQYTLSAYIGLTLFVATSRSNELSLANRFFDYMHAGVPQLCVAYPEYAAINAVYEVACLLAEVTPETIAAALNRMLGDEPYYQHLQQACLAAREVYCWQREEERLLEVYQKVLGGP